MDEVELVLIDRRGREHRQRMPRWLAELEVACIPHERPEIASARIEPYRPRIEPRAHYPARRANVKAAVEMGGFLAARLAA